MIVLLELVGLILGVFLLLPIAAVLLAQPVRPLDRLCRPGSAFNQTRDCPLAARLHIADTSGARFFGLLGARSADFPAGSGLWITPCSSVHTFAMAFPIDVVYLDAAGEVVAMREAVRPWRITPMVGAARSILELPARTITQTGTAVGDHINVTAVTVGQ